MSLPKPALRLRLHRRQPGPEGPARRQGCEPRRDDEPRSAGAARVHHHDRGLPGLPRPPARIPSWTRRSRAPGRPGETRGKKLGEPDDPLLVSVRSGAKFSMPGMMETVLNIGLNDESVRGLAKQSGNERFAWDSYRRLIQMFGKTVLGIDGEQFEDALDEAKRAKGTDNDLDLDAEDLRRAGRGVQGDRARARRAATSRRTRASSCDLAIRAVFDSWNADRGPSLPAAGAHPARPRHRGQRRHDGLRQPRPRLRHRRRLHPRPGHRRSRASTATTCRTRRARTSSPASATPCRWPSWRQHRQGRTTSCWASWRRWRTTTGTCATSSSPSSAARCGCCRPGSASAPPRPRSDRHAARRRGADRRRRGGAPGDRRRSSPS